MRKNFIYLTAICILLCCSLFGYEVKNDKRALEIAGKIKLIALDVDGVLTNGEIAYTSSGEEIKIFNVKDGLGMVLASQYGFITAIITGRESPMVERRGKELKVTHIYQGSKDKIKAIEELATKYNLELDEICYMGDDLPDLPVLKIVGLACCPLDAIIAVKEACGWISSCEGGKGAVRELTDFLIEAKTQ